MDPEFKRAVDSMFAVMKADYERFTSDFVNPEIYQPRLMIGSQYAKIVDRGSARGFIVLQDFTTKKGLVLKRGDLLKAASWSAPAMNFVRGNIFDVVSMASHVRWTGVG